MDAKTIHEQSIVIDGHCDTLLRIQMRENQQSLPPFLRQMAQEKGHIDLERMQQGGVTAQNFACYIPGQFLPSQATRETLRQLDTFARWQTAHSNKLCLATCAADIEQAKAQNKIAGLLSLEGAEGLEGDLGVLRSFYRLGVRWIGITWSHRNQAADGVFESRTGGGLTEFGVQLVKEMNRLGMIVDIAHLAPAGVKDVLAISKAPVIASHANARALCSSQRNLTDEQLAGVAASGGVVGVTYVPHFLTDDGPPATLDMVLDHVDYMVKQIGIDHVGLGSDFDGFRGPPTGLEDVSCTPNITAQLLERGYAAPEIKKIIGENWLRVIRQVTGK